MGEEKSKKEEKNQEKDELENINKEIKQDEEMISKDNSSLDEVNKSIDKDTENSEEKKDESSTEKSNNTEKPINKEQASELDETQQLIDELAESDKKKEEEVKKAEEKEKEKTAEIEEGISTHIYGLRTTANREDQVMDFLTSNADKKGFNVYSIIKAHGMRGYIFVEAETKQDAEQASFGVPYARGILPKEIEYKEIEHMIEQVKKDVNIQQNDIVEIISGPFKRENAKITRVDKSKEEVVVELLEAAVPIPITLSIDAVKVIRRDSANEE